MLTSCNIWKYSHSHYIKLKDNLNILVQSKTSMKQHLNINFCVHDMHKHTMHFLHMYTYDDSEKEYDKSPFV